MRRTAALAISMVIAILLGACGSASEDVPTTATAAASATSTTADAASPPATAPATSAPERPAPTSVPSNTTTVANDEDLAPDFTLELGNGGTFMLSEEARPVYMVFWAEW